MSFRDRIQRLERVRAGDLVPDPANPWSHSPEQQAAVRAVLDSVGYVGALIARELPDGRLGLLDGHLRQGLDPNSIVPVVVTDLTAEEARQTLALFNKTASMVEIDDEKMRILLSQVADPGGEVGKLLADMKGDCAAKETAQPPNEFPIVDENIETDHECPRCGYKYSGGKPVSGEA